MPLNKSHLAVPGKSYKRTIEYFYGLQSFGVKMGLTSIRAMLSLLGEPQKAFPVVHVGGSNGKGSTSVMVASMLGAAGYRVGLYTSPHLVRFNERIRVGRREISNRSIVELTQRIVSAIESNAEMSGSPTFFEITTALAFLYFAECDIDIAVVEVGMGGRLDATNVVTPIVSVVTNISRDHENILGSGVRAVAHEKAGIVKRGVALVTAARGVALDVLKDACRKRGAPIYVKGADFTVKGEDDGFAFIRGASSLTGLHSSLAGVHQLSNAACAIMAVELLREKGYALRDSAMKMGLVEARWPARMEVVGREPTVVIDCAHNPAGAEALRRALTDLPHKRLFLIIGIMADKDIRGIVSRLIPIADRVIVTAARTERAAPVDLLCGHLQPYGKPLESVEGVARACEAALSMADSDDLICVAGSLHTAGEARTYLVDERGGG